LTKQWLDQPRFVRAAKVSSASGQVEQSVFHVPTKDKPKLLANYIKNSGVIRSIVFTRTKHGADNLVRVLLKNGIDAVAIHGNKSQSARTRNLERFKSNQPPVLVATDIAARGLDVESVSHVINYHLPDVPEVYVHRIGRTGRADANGIAVAFCSPEERENLRGIERLLQISIPVSQQNLVVNSTDRDDDMPVDTPVAALAVKTNSGAKCEKVRKVGLNRKCPSSNKRRQSSSRQRRKLRT